MGAAHGGGGVLCPLGGEGAWRVPVLEMPLDERSLLCGLACRCVERRCVEIGEQEGADAPEARREAEEAVGPGDLRRRRLQAPLLLEDVFQDDGQDNLLAATPVAPVLLGSPVPAPCLQPEGARAAPLFSAGPEAGSPKGSEASAGTSISLTSSTDPRPAPTKGAFSPSGQRWSVRELGAPASPQRSLAWRPSSPKVMESRPDFGGHWACQSTWGLEAFLRSLGVSKLHRVALEQAPWPSWEFQQDGDFFLFMNHSFLGSMREEFEVGGAEYEAVDLRRQLLRCRAFWEDGTLVLEKCSPQGRFREERLIDDDGLLRFTLRSLEGGGGARFGRTFERRQARPFC